MKRPERKFRKGQLVYVIHDGTGPMLQPDFILSIEGYTKKYGWSYYVKGCSYPLAECQISQISRGHIER